MQVEEKSRIKVLLVDDEADFRQPVAKRLDRRGFDIRQAGGGREALAVLDEFPADIVVLDVKMPEMDGLTALGKIKELRPQCEVLLLTGQATAQDGVEGMKAGAFDYLGKPIEIDHLSGKIKQAFEKIERVREQALEAEYRAKMESRLIATERLASLGTMAAGVAHEINNPLAIISEAAGWLKSRASKEEALPQGLKDNFLFALGKIEDSVGRAKNITHQLLSFARKQDALVSEFDVHDLAQEVSELTKRAASGCGAAVEIENRLGRCTLWSDPNQLRQILLNLVTNALQAVHPQEGRVRILLQEQGPELAIIVQDNGAGIPRENLQRIFEPFFSTKPAGLGTGLGLSVSKGLVEKLGGRIEVESAVGVGSTFTVLLPRRPDQKC
ncbi:MAG: ATP-binding protein [Pseudomonadota bacterium]